MPGICNPLFSYFMGKHTNFTLRPRPNKSLILACKRFLNKYVFVFRTITDYEFIKENSLCT